MAHEMDYTGGGVRRSKWYQAKQDIEAKIRSGVYKQGERIPTIEQLMQLYDIGRTTAQRVLDELAAEDLILRKVGKGCFVKMFVRDKVETRHKEQAISDLTAAVKQCLEVGIAVEEMQELIMKAVSE